MADRDFRKPLTAPTGVPVLSDPVDDELTPVNAPTSIVVAKIGERVKAIESALYGSITRDEEAHRQLNEELSATNARIGELATTIASADGKLDVLIGDRTHAQKLEQIETVAETKLTIVEKKAALEDLNDRRAARRKIGLRFLQIIGAIVTMMAGGALGAGLHGC